MPIIANQSRDGVVTIRVTTSANESYIVAGNTSVSNLVTADDIAKSNIGSNSTSSGTSPYPQGNIVVIDAHIRKIAWVSNGTWSITRGANVVYQLPGEGVWDLQSMGMAANSANDYVQANLLINCTATSVGTLIITLKKNVSFTSEYN